MAKNRTLEEAVGVTTVKLERTTGGAVTGTIGEVLYDHGGGPTVVVIVKNNGDKFLIPWHAVRSIVLDPDD